MAKQEESYSERVQRILRQAAPPATDHGVVVLWRCSTCGKPWLQDGPHAYLRLTGDELTQALERTGADLAHLPSATCRLCAAQQEIGEIAFDEYGKGMGYGLSWEGPPPTLPHVIFTWALASYLDDQRRKGQGPRAGIVTQPARLRECLAWLAHVNVAAFMRYASPLTLQECGAMAVVNEPALLASEKGGWRWHGLHWRGILPPLSADAPTVITLAQALPIGEPFSQTLCVETMRQISATALTGKMAGE